MNPEKGYISLIINPKSGASSEKLLVNDFIGYLKNKNYKLQITNTCSLNHAQQLAADAAVKYDCSMVIVAGGDGTIRQVVQGLEASDKPLMLLPAGTENLLANELGYKKKLKNIIETFEAQQLHPLDLCKANDKFFTSVAGVGFDGTVVKKVDAQRDGNITHLHYFKPITQTFLNYNFPAMKIEIDGEEVFDGRCIVIFGNISRYAIGLPILKKADYGDGLLDVCIYKCFNKLSLAYVSALTVLKQHIKSKYVYYTQCKNLRITSSETIDVELDGDPGPALPLDVNIIPQAVKVLIPPHSKPAGMRTRIFKIIE